MRANETSFYGRDDLVRRIKALWDENRVRVIYIHADPGLGKSALGAACLQAILRVADARPKCFSWAPYSKGTGEHLLAGFSATLADLFLDRAIEYFTGEKRAPIANLKLDDWQKGRALGERLVTQGGVLFLDGLERQQVDPRRYDGLQHQGLIALLRTVAAGSRDMRRRCLCLVTTQTPLTQLKSDYPDAVEEIALTPLAPDIGAKFFEAKRIRGSSRDFETAAALFGGRPLDLRLLTGYLHASRKSERGEIDALYGEIPRKDYTGILASFDAYFERPREEPDAAGKYRQLLRITGLYDCPVDCASLSSLFGSRGIAGLTDLIPPPMVNGRPSTKWLKFVEHVAAETSLIDPVSDGSFDTHQLIRAHAAAGLRAADEHVFKEGHRRLVQYLLDLGTEARKEGDPIQRIALLYDAMAMSLRAGEYDEAFRIYHNEVQGERDDLGQPRHEAINLYGIVNPEALGPFYRTTAMGRTWSSPTEEDRLGEQKGAIVIAETAVEFWHRGRLTEAREAHLVAEAAYARLEERARKEGNRTEACRARRARSEQVRRMGEVAAVQGCLAEASSYARESVNIARADKDELGVDANDAEQLARSLATLGWVHHLRGEYEDSQASFEHGAQASPDGELHFIFAAWHAALLLDREPSNREAIDKAIDLASRVGAEAKGRGILLDEAWSHLVLGFATLHRGRMEVARGHIKEAISYARLSRQQTHSSYFMIVNANFLVTQSLFASARSDREQAEASLDEAARLLDEADLIVRPRVGSADTMKTHLADYYLASTRLALARGDLVKANVYLDGGIDDNAAEWIERCDYGRGRPQLDRLRTILTTMKRLRDDVETLCADFGYDHDLTMILKLIQSQFMKTAGEDQAPREGPKAHGKAEVPELAQAEITDPSRTQLRGLRERVETLLGPLVAELPSLLAEFGTGSGDHEGAVRQVWSVVEQAIRPVVEKESAYFTRVSEARSTGSERLDSERFLRVREAAQMFGIKEQTLTKLGQRGKLGELVGDRYLFSLSELRNYIENPPRLGRPRKS